MLIPTIIALITLTGVILNSEKIKRVIDTTINQLGLNENSERLVIFSKTYEGHYLIALNMFKEKPILGHGAKSLDFIVQKKKILAPNA